MKIRYSVFVVAALVASCSAEDGSKSKASNSQPLPQPAPQPAPANTELALAVAPASASAAISSVVIAQDCPDPKAESAADGKAPAGASRGQARDDRARSSRGYSPICTQSYLHLAFREQGPHLAKVQIKAVRLLSDKGEVLMPLKARAPSTWKDNSYSPWGETLPASGDLDASYKLSIPSWSEVESKTGRPSHGVMFSVEVDIEIAGTLSTLASSAFERTESMNVRT